MLMCVLVWVLQMAVASLQGKAEAWRDDANEVTYHLHLYAHLHNTLLY
jgi:hypothetical protein